MLRIFGLYFILISSSFKVYASENYNSIGLKPNQLAIIVNVNDPLSVKIGNYYVKQRSIPIENIINVNLEPKSINISPSEFNIIIKKVLSDTPNHIQAYGLTWITPYKVNCMSITTAFAAGYDESFCAKGCIKTRKNPYYDSISSLPFDDTGWRLAMSIASKNFEKAKELIDRGLKAEASNPKGTAYLLNTSDQARNVRAIYFPKIIKSFNNKFKTVEVKDYAIWDKEDVLFYFTGQANVYKLDRLKFLPGAIGDHLTSLGGQLNNTEGSQMSALKWLEAGATGSYGAVVEPCAFVEKFPNPSVVMKYYLKGETLIEAYWKSVEWPGQGIFIGDPLAKPFYHQPKN